VVKCSCVWAAAFRRLARDHECLADTLNRLHLLAFAVPMTTRFVDHMAQLAEHAPDLKIPCPSFLTALGGVFSRRGTPRTDPGNTARKSYDRVDPTCGVEPLYRTKGETPQLSYLQQRRNYWKSEENACNSGMEFPNMTLLSPDACGAWIVVHVHPDGLQCPRCQASVEEAHPLRRTRKSQLKVFRYDGCATTYNLIRGTVFQQRQLTPQRVVLLLQGILKGAPSTDLAAELGVSYITVLQLRRDLQDQAMRLQPDPPLPNDLSETDEMFQNAGKKRATCPSTRSACRGHAATSGADVAPMPTIVRPCWGCRVRQWAGAPAWGARYHRPYPA
jgi:transposase-like protein